MPFDIAALGVMVGLKNRVQPHAAGSGHPGGGETWAGTVVADVTFRFGLNAPAVADAVSFLASREERQLHGPGA